MRNFANGFGFVYNPGGEKVEGFTSILYTLIGSAIFLLTDKIEIILFIINIIAVSYLIYKVSVFIHNLNNRKFNPYRITLILTFLLLVMPGYFFWTTLSLMESGIWSLLLCLTILAIFDENTLLNCLKFILLIGILIVTRPEAYFWAFYLIILKGLFNYLFNKITFKSVIKETGLFTFIYIALLTLFLLWRQSYFGYLLPNTYYVKVYGSFWYNIKLGIEYLISFLIYTNPLIILTLITTLFVIKINFKDISHHEAIQLILSMIILAALAIPVVLGGDYFKWNRFYIVFLPIMYVPLFNINFIEKYIMKLKGLGELILRGKYLIYSALVIFIVLLPRESLDQLLRGESLANSNYISEDGRNLVLFLNDFFYESDLPTISVIAAGMAYKYKGETFDLMGLNNSKMAHSEHKIKGYKNHDGFNKRVFFEMRPDFIGQEIINNPVDFTIDIYNSEFKKSFFNKALDEIWFDKQFQENYKPVIINKKNTDKNIFTWASTDYLLKLDSLKFQIKYLNYPKN
jgi:hypothetical protein